MKNSSIRLALASALLAALPAASRAQEWQTIYNSAIQGRSEINGDAGVDAAGGLHVVGRAIAPDGTSQAIVKRSADGGTTWNDIDAYAEPGLSYTHHRAFAVDSGTGALLAGGNLNNLLPNGAYEFDTLWFIRQWTPETGVWQTIDDSLDLLNEDLGQASCADILVTPGGDVYATGGGQLGTGLGWLVRRRAAGSPGFAAVDVDRSGRTAGAGWDLAYHPQHGIFAVGEVNGIWTVRGSLSGDLGSWATKDSFTVRRQWGGGQARSVLVAGNGDVFVAGSAYSQKTYKNHWVVRRSTDGGGTWTIVDDVAPGGTQAAAHGIAEDGRGGFLACGYVMQKQPDGSFKQHWIVRRGNLVTKTIRQKGQTLTTLVWEWATIDDYQIAPGQNAWANVVTVDAQGNVFTSGSGRDGQGIERMVVRTSPAQ